VPKTAPSHRIDFIELPAKSTDELARAKQFFAQVFRWSYQDWGDDYADTTSSGVGSGINADPDHRPRYPLPVIYAEELEQTRRKIVAANGKITRDIFPFPGGRRFHFQDPSGNELAVWSDK
jgi:predicted enzyme related to lactoylglutathione lyase